MGAGASKHISSIPDSTIVKILAMEGLVKEAMEQVAECIQECMREDNPYYWKQLAKWHRLLVDRNKLHTLAILELLTSQERG